MRHIAILILVLISMSSKAQFHIRMTQGYVPESRCKFGYKTIKTMWTLRSKVAKLTVKPSLNPHTIVDQLADESFLGVRYAEIMKYDVRVKLYVTRKFSLVYRVQMNEGIVFNGDFISCSLQFRPLR